MTIKLNGSTAGSVALDAPASTTGNADITFKLPIADGTAGQVLQTDGAGNLSWVSPNSGLVKLATIEVTEANASTTAFHFNNVFSSTYSDYMAYFDIRKTAMSPNVFCCQFGKGGGGSVITSNFYARGTAHYHQLATANEGQLEFLSSQGVFQLNGTMDGSTSGFGVKGTAHITDPYNNNSSNGVGILTEIIMQYHTTHGDKWREEGAAMGSHGEQSNLTDIRFGIVAGDGSANNVLSSATFANLYGRCSIYGVVK